MVEGPKSDRWLHKAFAAVLVVLVTATGARVAWALLEPIVPALVLVVALVIIFSVIFGKFRR